jgi:acetyltransferase-like isoleucine patch superfamily enzyme
MPLPTVRLGTYLRTWGFRTHGGVFDVAPMRIRGILARRRHVSSGGALLLLRKKVEIVKRDGRDQRLILGSGVRIAEHARLVFEGPHGLIEIGEDSFLNARCEIRAREHIRIGAHCRLAFDVIVMDTNHHDLAGSLTTAPTIIGDRVWIGARSLILRGVTIGDGAVVGAGSIVTRDVPERTLVAGNPARQIRTGVTWQ